MNIHKESFPYSYIPDWMKDIRLTPEMMRIISELPENQKCEECNKTIWVCECNVF